MPTFAVFLHDLSGEYQLTVLTGAADFAREHHINLICLAGGELESPRDFYHMRTVLYKLTNTQNVDGLVILSGLLGNFVGMEALKTFCNSYLPMPMVSVSVPVEGIPSIMTDNKTGMRELVNHLIEVHGHRRIVFVKGNDGNLDSELRYAAYRETLAEHGIPFDPVLIVRSDYYVSRTIVAIEGLIKQGISFDAVTAANDEMAIAAMKAIQASNLRVPDDIAVGGFDDIETAHFTMSPLTTVRQPLYEVGRCAIESLVRQLQGQPIPPVVSLPTSLVVRQSCGCLSQAAQRVTIQDVSASEETLEILLALRHRDIITEMTAAAGIPTRGIETEDIEELFHAFASEFTSYSPNAFLSTLDRIARQTALEGGDSIHLQSAVSTLRQHVLPALIHSGPAVLHMESLWQQSQILITELIQRAQNFRALQVKQRARSLSEFIRDMNSSSTVDELVEVVAHYLPLLGIEACYLCLFEYDESHPHMGLATPPEWSRLIMAYNEQGRVALEPGGWRFPSSQLIPNDLLPLNGQYYFVVEPLYFKEDLLGMVVFTMSRDVSSLYEEIREPLSSVLRGLQVIKEHEQVEANLRQLNQLKTEFVSTAAHELRTPLTSIQGFSELLLSRKLDEARQQRYLTLINQQSAQLTTIINDLLDISRLESKRHLTFALEPLNIADLVTSVSNALSETSPNHRIQIQGLECCPQVVGDHFRLTQVINNLLSNAIKYSPDGGSVTISAEVIPGFLEITVRDQGIGMTPEQQRHLFEKFYRADASNTGIGGTGLGLAISKLIIELLGGSIWADSEYGVGTAFHFTLPLPPTSA